jgi:hypothetical protein
MSAARRKTTRPARSRPSRAAAAASVPAASEAPWKSEAAAAADVGEELDVEVVEDAEELELEDLSDEDEVELPAVPGPAEEEEESEW